MIQWSKWGKYRYEYVVSVYRTFFRLLVHIERQKLKKMHMERERERVETVLVYIKWESNCVYRDKRKKCLWSSIVRL